MGKNMEPLKRGYIGTHRHINAIMQNQRKKLGHKMEPLFKPRTERTV